MIGTAVHAATNAISVASRVGAPASGPPLWLWNFVVCLLGVESLLSCLVLIYWWRKLERKIGQRATRERSRN